MSTIKIKTSWTEVNLEVYLQVADIQMSKDFENLNLQKVVKLITSRAK